MPAACRVKAHRAETLRIRLSYGRAGAWQISHAVEWGDRQTPSKPFALPSAHWSDYLSSPWSRCFLSSMSTFRFEAAVSDVMGCKVKGGGRFGIGLFPNGLVAFEDVHIGNPGTAVATA